MSGVAEDILKTEGLSIGYDKELIRDITLKLSPGCIMSLIGPNGSGKSTLLKTLSAQLKKKRGTVFLSGEDMQLMKPADLAKSMSMVMTSAAVPELMSCREIVNMGRYPYTGMLGILNDEDKKQVENALKLTYTSDIADRPFCEVSDGQRQRIMLARAICQQPEVLILDEPTSFLDIRFKIQILDIVRKLAKEHKVAVLMSLHELNPAMRISDCVVAIGEAGIERVGAPRDVFEESFIRRLYGIEGADVRLMGETPWFTDCKAEIAGLDEDDVLQDGSRGASDEVTVLPGRSREKDMMTETGTSAKAGVRSSKGVIMIQGTMSSAGKSLIAAGLCRVFARAGYRVAPFKSQNMALNSYVTAEGLEMGRAQVMQAECCMREPLVSMNPVLLKPTDDKGSQVIVNGRVVGNMRAVEYFKYKTQLVPEIMKAFENLKESSDIIVIEGAGSPVELNLKKNDIVNMGLAEMTGATVILVGDIDRGGVFAQLCGTVDLLTDEERAMVGGLIVNKFRGDIKLFEDGIRILEDKSGKKVLGVVPWADVKLEDEDSLSDRFVHRDAREFDIAVIRLPHISNFTDFDVFEQSGQISVRYITDVSDLGDPDIIMLPGSKNTIGDLRWLKEKGFDKELGKRAFDGTVIFGICGGYQMLGLEVSDPEESECGGSELGLGLLPVATVMSSEKTRTQFKGNINNPTGILTGLAGMDINGYEIHMGKTEQVCSGNDNTYTESGLSDTEKSGTPDRIPEFTSGSTGYCSGNIYGTYIHGIFDAKGVASKLVELVAAARNKNIDTSCLISYRAFKETQYEKLADILEASLDMPAIYEMLGLDQGRSGGRFCG